MNRKKTKYLHWSVGVIWGFMLLFTFTGKVNAQVYQWSVPIKSFVSTETNDHPTAFLWIPENCRQVKAVVFSQQNMCEETIFNHAAFRGNLAKLDFAIVWIAPGIDQQWDVRNGCQEAFDSMMVDLANVSGYSELKYAPVVPLGHSAMATFPWNFAAWNPERTLAVISYKGDAPRTNLTGYGRENLEWGRIRNIDGIPGLMIEGEYEWWEARVNPALAFRMMYPESCISFLYDAGQGHFDVADKVVNYINLFLQKAAAYRLPKHQELNQSVELTSLNPDDGWLAERWQVNKKKRAKTAPFKQYKGDSHDAFWYFDKEIAEATETYYKQNRNREMQYIGFEMNGDLIPINAKSHAQYQVALDKFENHQFNLKAVFTDSLHSVLSDSHAKGELHIDKICGPVEKINDSTFKVNFYRMGMKNLNRSGDIWLSAYHEGDKDFKSAVQQINIKVPFRLIEGKPQEIRFSPIPDVDINETQIELKATSTAELPVGFYIKEGPANIENNSLVFTTIPPRSNFPVKVTVVAWQNGSITNPRVQSAEPVEQSFYLTKVNVEN